MGEMATQIFFDVLAETAGENFECVKSLCVSL
jgi:hypothetical protein